MIRAVSIAAEPETPAGAALVKADALQDGDFQREFVYAAEYGGKSIGVDPDQGLLLPLQGSGGFPRAWPAWV